MTTAAVSQQVQAMDASTKWAAALDKFDSMKHNFQAPEQIEKALNSIPLGERVLLFRGSYADILQRLSAYDTMQGELPLAKVCYVFLQLTLYLCISRQAC